jgi:hypothetical protein
MMSSQTMPTSGKTAVKPETTWKRVARKAARAVMKAAQIGFQM